MVHGIRAVEHSYSFDNQQDTDKHRITKAEAWSTDPGREHEAFCHALAGNLF
jgi:hypothetical protein